MVKFKEVPMTYQCSVACGLASTHATGLKEIVCLLIFIMFVRARLGTLHGSPKRDCIMHSRARYHRSRESCLPAWPCPVRI
jgi:hypothetical protein